MPIRLTLKPNNLIEKKLGKKSWSERIWISCNDFGQVKNDYDMTEIAVKTAMCVVFCKI